MIIISLKKLRGLRFSKQLTLYVICIYICILALRISLHKKYLRLVNHKTRDNASTFVL